MPPRRGCQGTKALPKPSPDAARRQGENSDVFPEASVAVAATPWPGGAVRETPNVTWPPASVVTVVSAIRVSP